MNLFANDLLSAVANAINKENPTLNTNNVNSLVFANDWATSSLSQKGLQQQIDTLEKCCRDWSLEVNIKKLKLLNQ